MAQRPAQAASADRIPLCRVAVHGAEVAGGVSLVENDHARHTEWHPWLAGPVVVPDWRGRGLGSRLARNLLADARRPGLRRVCFGTGAPGFYTRPGAVEQARPHADFCFMRCELQAAQAG